MLALLKDLIRHKGYANSALLSAVRQHEKAAQDRELRELLHHIILANRFWLSLTLELPFAREAEASVPESIEAVATLYRETYELEMKWIAQLEEPALTRILETPRLPGRTFSVAQAFIQVCMHSHGHRAQCATMLRSLGGKPPWMDFILWLNERPAADWS